MLTSPAVNTSLAVIYEPVFTYPVRAGIGKFNGTYVRSYIENFNKVNPDYRLQVVPYTDMSLVHDLVVNPIHSVISAPINCPSCDSYLLPGGLAIATPWPPTNYTQEPVIVIHSAMSTQIQFKEGLPLGDTFQEDDCNVFGDNQTIIGIRFCAARSKVEAGSFLAARTNFSILSVSDNGPATQYSDLDLPGYQLALQWLLNYTAAGIPAPSSIAEYFWSAPTQLSNDYWSIELRQALHSILAFPFWVFNTNNYGNIALDNLTDTSALPLEYHTTAAVAAPYTRIIVNRSMFILFVVLQSSVLLFCWIVIFWLFFTDQRLLALSSYPLMDFTFKTKNVRSDEPLAMQQPFTKPARAGSKEIRETASNMTISIHPDVDKARPIWKPWRRNLSRHSKVMGVPPVKISIVSTFQDPNSATATHLDLLRLHPRRSQHASVLTAQSYADFQVSDGVAGNALAEVNAKFPIDQTDLANVSDADLQIIQDARVVAEDAETGTGGFNDEIAAAGDGDGTALQNGKIKNKVLKLQLEVLGLQIEAAQGNVDQAKIDEGTTKLNSNIALDEAAAGQTSVGVTDTFSG
ncbi:hypothetical protein LTS15_001064 [Exophiala xenobiotica]|nr:hypothetical protein LTS15_001064 [Exophiala xenobiotica]